MECSDIKFKPNKEEIVVANCILYKVLLFFNSTNGGVSGPIAAIQICPASSILLP